MVSQDQGKNKECHSKGYGNSSDDMDEMLNFHGNRCFAWSQSTG